MEFVGGSLQTVFDLRQKYPFEALLAEELRSVVEEGASGFHQDHIHAARGNKKTLSRDAYGRVTRAIESLEKEARALEIAISLKPLGKMGEESANALMNEMRTIATCLATACSTLIESGRVEGIYVEHSVVPQKSNG